MGARLRICHLGKYYPPASGGMETHVRELARGQAELGADVRVVCVNHQSEAGQDVTWDIFRRTPALEEWDGQVRITRLARRASLARLDVCPGLPGLLRQLARGEIDLLHLHTPNPSMILALNIWARSVPLVVSHHSDVVRQKLLGWFFRGFERRVYRRVGVILTSSPEYAGGSPLLQRFTDRVRPLPLGIDLEPFLKPSSEALTIANELKRRHGEPIWLSVGRLVYYKGLDNAIQALSRVPGRLLMIGQGPMAAALKTLARQVGVAERVEWLGSVDPTTLVGAYRAATALWFPSNARSEGFGLVQVEAMASGCPVINTNIPHSGVAWVCRHEREGLTAPMNDPPALAEAAKRLLRERGLRERLAESGRERAKNEFDWRLMCRRCLEEYERVVRP